MDPEVTKDPSDTMISEKNKKEESVIETPEDETAKSVKTEKGEKSTVINKEGETETLNEIKKTATIKGEVQDGTLTPDTDKKGTTIKEGLQNESVIPDEDKKDTTIKEEPEGETAEERRRSASLKEILEEETSTGRRRSRLKTRSSKITSVTSEAFHKLSSRLSRDRSSRLSTSKTPGIGPSKRSSEISLVSEMSIDQDIVTLTVPETAQKIVHCQIGKDLFVDKTWCMVTKKDLLEDVAIEDVNSPFFSLTRKILEYKPEELLIGYEPFSSEPNQFMLCITEAGRDDVLNKLEEMKQTYLERIQQSKAVEAKPWESLGSEKFVDQFQIKQTRKPISLEWIGDITKRVALPTFQDCDPDDMKNGYTCLMPPEKEKYELVFKKTQEIGIQAIPNTTSAEAQTEPEIPTNASTQYAPETEIIVPDSKEAQAAMKSEGLEVFFKKYLDYLLECLNYNEVYDLYHDDYPALYVSGEETQVQQLGTYHQYQSFTDVGAIEDKLIISCSWHPNYTGIVAIAYANEIPCLMKELEFDSDQTDYEEEKTDDEGEKLEEPELGAGAKDWLEDERKEREAAVQNTEQFERAMKRLKDIESAKVIWDAKIQEETEESRKTHEEESNVFAKILQYREYKEPEPEPKPEDEEKTKGESVTQISEGQEEMEEEREYFERVGEEYEADYEEEEESEQPLVREALSQKTMKSKISLREQLEADISTTETSVATETDVSVGISGISAIERLFDEDSLADARLGTKVERKPKASKLQPTKLSKPLPQRSLTMDSHLSPTTETQRSLSSLISSDKRATHHRKKHGSTRLFTSRKQSMMEERSTTSSSILSSSMSEFSKPQEMLRETHPDTLPDTEFFDEITDEEEIKEKQDELPLLEVNNPVLIWSFVDDLTPKLRLDSPYEVRVVQFARHDGNLIAGGTASGQVVLWDITGRIEKLETPETLTQDQQFFRKRMEDLMHWRRDIRSKRRVRCTAITNQKESHLEKITGLMWLAPTVVVNDSVDILSGGTRMMPNLQILTCSIFGGLSVWDLRYEPPKADYRRTPQIFKTKERYGRPASLDQGLSPFSKLNRIWKPTCKVSIVYKSLPVLLTGVNPPHILTPKFVRVHPKPPGVVETLEDRIEYKPVFGDLPVHPRSLFVSNLFGQAGTCEWNPLEKGPESENVIHLFHYWDSYHDGPITNLSKHPFLSTVCLTVGGHVWAVWHVENPEEPILTKRYYGVFITDGQWSQLRPSLMRIARSDGVVEIWDLIIQNHAPATTIIVSGKVITNISPPLLPEAKGLLGVADYNSAFCLFFIPIQFRMWTESEFERLQQFLNREPERKKKMKEWSKWWRENNVNLDREEKRIAEEKRKQDEEVKREKEQEEEARKKYNEEVFKWYMRRRGKSFLWAEEADEKWRQKEEEYMHEMVMAKKKIDRAEMEILMRPIVRGEKNEALKHAKAQERLKQADTIFRQTVELIFPKASKEAQIVTETNENLSDSCYKLMEHYLSNFNKLADEQVEFIERNPWQFEFEWSELLEKYNKLRMLFNDRRRKRSKTLRWLRKKLREELLKEGRKVHVRKSRMDRYPKRKIQRRAENLEWLKETYGDNYNIYWDQHQPCRIFANRKFRYAVEDTETLYLGDVAEPDVDYEEAQEVFDDEKVLSSLEMITEVGIEHIDEETFSADLDTALLTIESRTSLGVKSIPGLTERVKSISQTSALASISLQEVMESEKSKSVSRTIIPTTPIVIEERSDEIPSSEKMLGEEPSVGLSYLSVRGMQSPQDGSDVSTVGDDNIVQESPSLLDNQLQELDYIQQPVGTKINTLQTKKAVGTQKREISHGIKIKVEDSISDDFIPDEDSAFEIDAELAKDEFDEEFAEDEIGEELAQDKVGEELSHDMASEKIADEDTADEAKDVEGPKGSESGKEFKIQEEGVEKAIEDIDD